MSSLNHSPKARQKSKHIAAILHSLHHIHNLPHTASPKSDTVDGPVFCLIIVFALTELLTLGCNSDNKFAASSGQTSLQACSKQSIKTSPCAVGS
eukprot:1152493-Pelagomonas_calceolata.AAC.8